MNDEIHSPNSFTSLQQSGDLFYALFENMAQLGWAAKADGSADFFNRGWYEYTGTTYEEVKDWGWQNVVEPAAMPEVLNSFRRAVQTKSAWQMKFPIRRHDGVFRWFQARVNPVHDSHGAIIRWVGINTDIHDEIEQQRRLELALSAEKQALLKAEQDRERFTDLADSMPCFVWAASPDGNTYFQNKTFWSYTGLSPEAIRGWKWQKIIHPDDLGTTLERWETARRTVTPYKNEFRLRRFDGQYRWFTAVGLPILDKRGEVTNWYGNCTDIHEQKTAGEREIEQLQTILDAMPVATWTTNPDGGCTYVNKLWLELSGATLPQVLDQGWLEYLHPEDRARTAQAWQEFIDYDKPYCVEFRLGSEGNWRWVLTRGVKIHDHEGKLVRTVGGCTEITEHKHHGELLERTVRERTEELSQSKNLLETVLESISDAIIVANADGQVTYLNKAARELHGETTRNDSLAEVPVAFDLYELDGITHVALEKLPLARALAGHGVDDTEMIIKSHDRNFEIVASVSARPFFDRSGKLKGAVVVVRDITNRKRAELEVSAARDEALAANAAKGRFLSTVSHEVRTPMSAIIGLLELLSLDNLEEESASCVDHALDSAKRLMQILNDMLHAAQLQSGEIVLVERLFPLRAVLGDIRQMIKLEADQKNLEVLGEIDPNIPEYVVGDEVQLRRLLLNLAYNAVKFTESGEIRLRASLAEIHKDSHCSILFEISDTGCGIAPDRQQTIFEAFEQIHSTEGKLNAGLGLGLSIAHQVVLLMKGRLSLSSELGKGSTFRVNISFKLEDCS